MKSIRLAAVFFLLTTSLWAKEPLVVAHRGASGDAPENTISAFKLAWERGADAIEGDFHLTADGHIVCIHDANTKKVSGKSLVVRQSSLKQLRELDVGTRHGKRFAKAVIPTLAEVLATVPAGKKIYIEIKSGASIIPYLFKEIDKSHLRPEQIVVISFHEQVIRGIEAKAPHFKTLWLVGFKKDDSKRLKPTMPAVLATLARIKTDGLSSSSGITETSIRNVRQRGYEYHVWTIDDPAAAQRFRKWGAQSITTNRPGRIRKHLVSETVERQAP